MKRALVISGGGQLANYSVGAIKHLLRDLRLGYDIYTGVSAGAIIASFLAQYPAGQEDVAAEKLAELFSNQGNKDIKKHWLPLFFLHGFWKGGFYNTKPLRKNLAKYIDPEAVADSGKELIIGGTCLDSGVYEHLPTDPESLIKSVLASAAFPGAFAPVEINGKHYIDGGVRNNAPLKDAIDAGATHIDVVMISPESNERATPEKNALKVAVRAIDILTDEILANDVKLAMLYNKLGATRGDKRFVHIRVVRPSVPLPGSALDFDKDVAAELQEIGYKDAVEKLTE